MLQEVNKDNYEAEVEMSSGLTLVDFWGQSCQPCLALMPFMEDLAEKHKDRLKIVKVDSAKNRRLCINLKVMSLPTIILYQDGKEVERIGNQDANKESIIAAVDKYL